MDFNHDITNYITKLKGTIDLLSIDDINTVMNDLVDAYNTGKQVFIMGNGGSAATASHFVCDFNKGVSFGKSKRLKFLCLNDNIPTMMAYGNDISYDDIFIEPLKNYFNPGDLVIGISGSGNSKNVLKAMEYANANGALTIGITGYDGGKLKKICRHNLHVPVNDMQITEDLHMVFDHLMMKILSEKLK